MSSRNRKPVRTTRRILKVASLGLAGLIAGLLAGCSSSAVEANSSFDGTLTAGRLFDNLDYHRTPEIRRAPTLHHQHPMSARSTTTYAMASQIDDLGHHYTPRFPVQ